MRTLTPSKRVREEFHLTYELQGAQKAVDLLAKYYKIRKMKIIVDGRKAGKRCLAIYCSGEHSAYFKRKAIKKNVVLHEFYHHLIHAKKLKVKGEENEADKFAKAALKTRG